MNVTEPQNTPAATAMGVHRGGKYSVNKDTAITRAYINFTKDAILESDQNKGTYYAKIWEVYKFLKPEDSVTFPLSAVQTKIMKILKDTFCFSACLESELDLKK